MKNSNRILKIFLIIASFGWILQASSCGGDDPVDPDNPDLTPQEVATEILTSGTWVPTSVSRQGSDVTTDYSGFTLTFTNSGFSTTNGGSAWPASGSWAFDGESATRIIRDGNVSITLSVSSGSLVMDFSLDEDVFGARTKSINASYSFSMAQ